MKINEVYEEKSQKFNDMITEENLVQSLSEEELKFVDILENILNSNTLYIEDKESGDALVLSEGINSNVFETVAVSSYNILEDIISEDDDDDEEEDSEEDSEDSEEDEEDEEEEDSEENEAEEDDEEDSDESDEEAEVAEEGFEDEADKVETQEAILNLINANEYVIKSDLENEGIIVNENSPYFKVIRESLIERLIDTCESDEELAECEEILKEYENSMFESAGYGIDEVESKEELVEDESTLKKAIGMKYTKLSAIEKTGDKEAIKKAKAGIKAAKKNLLRFQKSEVKGPAKYLKGKADWAKKMKRKETISGFKKAITGAKEAGKEFVKKGVGAVKAIPKAGKIAAVALPAAAITALALRKKLGKRKALVQASLDNSGRTANELVEGKFGSFLKGVGILKDVAVKTAKSKQAAKTLKQMGKAVGRKSQAREVAKLTKQAGERAIKTGLTTKAKFGLGAAGTIAAPVAAYKGVKGMYRRGKLRKLKYQAKKGRLQKQVARYK